MDAFQFKYHQISLVQWTPRRLVPIFKSCIRTSKNYLAPAKPKFLFLALWWCSMQTEKTVAAFLLCFTRNVLIIWTTLFQPFSHLLWDIPCHKYLNESVTKRVQNLVFPRKVKYKKDLEFFWIFRATIHIL